MALLSMEQQKGKPATRWVPFALGFRPFFLLAGAAGVILMLVWLMLWHGLQEGYYGQVGWHSHEMLFGYAVAVIAGFLLTAVRNWTGIDTPAGRPLALLALLWLAGRLMPWLPVPEWVVACVDMAFLPMLTLALVRPLWLGENRINRVFIPLLLSMSAANLLVHLQFLGIATTAIQGQGLMLNLVLLLILLVAGRVLPFFTRAVIPDFQPVTRAWVEWASYLLIGLIAMADLFSIEGAPSGMLYAVFGLVQALRLSGWHHLHVWKMPVQWVLHVGYLWLAAGSGLLALAEFGLFLPSAAMHAMTAGAIGIFTLGMMARVALGHSGRSIEVVEPMTWAFVVLNLGVLMRVFGPALLPQYYLLWILLSGLLWVMAFTIFLVIYLPILLRPRVDGKPG